jgi:hypothetical protein
MESDSITDRNGPYHNAKIDGEAWKRLIRQSQYDPIGADVGPALHLSERTTCTQMILENVDCGV